MILLPTYIQSVCYFPAGKQNHYTTQGLWVIIGLFAFLLLEKMFPDQDGLEDATSESDLNFNLSVSSLFASHVSTSQHTLLFSMACSVQRFSCLVCISVRGHVQSEATDDL